MTVQSAVLRALRRPRGTAPQGFGETKRRDSWAVYPVIQAIVFTVCAGYLTFSGVLWGPLFGPQYVDVDNYLSPLFSPLIVFPNMPTWLSPGLLILWIPIGFRATCYYYRKAYYRFYFADPPGCAVGEPTVHRKFALENALPFVLQNLHRYLLYLAFIPLFFLWVDVGVAFANPAEVAGAWQPRLGFGGALLFLEYRPADRLLAVVPLAAAPGRRPDRLLLVHGRAPGPLHALAAAHGPEPQPHVVGLDEPDHGDARGPLRPRSWRSG